VVSLPPIPDKLAHSALLSPDASPTSCSIPGALLRATTVTGIARKNRRLVGESHGIAL
jgi:hypothetical protein